MNDPMTRLSVLHVIVRAGPTNSQYNEHCLPVAEQRAITVCSLFPADVTPPPSINLLEGDGTKRGCFKVLRRSLALGSYDVVHVHAPASGVLTLAACLWTQRSRNDLIFTVHNSWQNFRRRNRLFLRLIIALFPLIVVCGRAAYDSIPTKPRRRHARKLRIVPNGVDVDRIDALLDRLPPRDLTAGRTIASVNRLIAIKNPRTLLAAFLGARRYGDRLVFVGDGTSRGELEESVRRQGLQSRVSFTGTIPRDEVYRVLAGADVFVSTSGGEGLPVAVLEAMACGCPVVVSDIPPHREIAEAVPGIALIPVGDVRGFARAIGWMLALTEQERLALGQELRASVAENFSVRAMNRAYGEVYMSTTNVDGRDRSNRYLSEPGQSAHEALLLTKMRQRLGLTVVLTLLGGLGGFLFAELQVPLYKGETTILVGSAIGAAADEDEIKTSAAMATSYADLARREPVLGPVAAQGYADDWLQLRDEVHTQTGDKNKQLVQISAYASTPGEAREFATAIARELIRAARAGAATHQIEFLQDQLREIEVDINRTTAGLRNTQQRLDQVPKGEPRPVLRERAERLQSTLIELQRGYGELRQAETSDVATVTLIDPTWVTRTPLRPTPVALVLAGAGIGFGLAAAWVQLFDRGRRRPTLPATTSTPQGRHEEEPGSGNGVRPTYEPWSEPDPVRRLTPSAKEGEQP